MPLSDDQECKTIYEEQCTTKYETACETKYDQECSTTYEERCETVFDQKCETIYDQVCEVVSEENCEDEICEIVDIEECRNVPREECENVPRQECSQVPVEECRQIPRQECVQVPRQECSKVPREDCSRETVKSNLRTSAQTLKCYGSGESFKTTDYIRDLKTINFDQTISSCEVNGTWLLFEGNNYHGNVFWVYGYKNTVKVPKEFTNSGYSTKFVGEPDDWLANSLNIYFDENFDDEEEFHYEDVPEMENGDKAKSLIVTGCKPWTLYQKINYEGLSTCVFPSDTTQCTPGLYPTRNSLGEYWGKIASAKRGCFSEAKLEGESSTISSSGASGFLSMNSNIVPVDDKEFDEDNEYINDNDDNYVDDDNEDEEDEDEDDDNDVDDDDDDDDNDNDDDSIIPATKEDDSIILATKEE